MTYTAPGHRAVTGLLAVTVTTALTTSLLPPVASAAPAAAAGPAAAAAEDEPLPEASFDEKYRAAVVVNAGLDNKLLGKADRDFVFGIFERAGDDDLEVRAAALAAYRNGSNEAATVFIRTGIFEAHERDNAARIERRLAREAKQRAWAALGVAPSPEQLGKDDRNFVLEVFNRASAPLPDGFPRVAAAAQVALQADQPAAYKQFIDVDVFAAVKQDQQDAVDRTKDKSEAELAELRRRDALKRAAAVLGIVATEDVLVLDNQNFVRLIANRAATGTEVDAEAEAALHDSDPDVWKHFIEVEIFAANQRDIAEERRKQAEADRQQARIIQAEAENSLVHPRLAAAAAAALAGTDADVGLFIRKTQYEVLEQTLQTTNATWQGWYVPNGAGVVTLVPQVGADQAKWKIVKGLADADCHSLESTTRPGYFLREDASAAKVAANDGSAAFKTAATWCAKKSGSGVSFESKSKPGNVLRHRGTGLWVVAQGTARDIEDLCGWAADTTWKIGGLDTPAADPAKAEDPCAPLVNHPAGGTGLVRQQVRDGSLVSYRIPDQKSRTAAQPYALTGWTSPGEMAAGSFGFSFGGGTPDRPTLGRKYRVVAVERSTGKLWLYDSRDARREIGSGGWNGMRELTVGNFHRETDGPQTPLTAVDDVVAVERSTGKLWLYPGNNDDAYRLGGRVELGRSGWNGMNNLISGNFNHDQYEDLVAVERSTGKLWLYPGTKDNKLGDRVVLGSGGWAPFSRLAAGDFTGDGKSDIVAIDGPGTTWRLYPGAAAGKLGTPVVLTLQ